MSRITTFVRTLENTLDSKNPWSNTYGLARTLIALGTLSSLLFNRADFLFRPAPGSEIVPVCRDYNSFGLFCLVDNLQVAIIIAIILLLIVASGYRPRIMGPIHWYITYSYTTSATLLDGGDHISTILTTHPQLGTCY